MIGERWRIGEDVVLEVSGPRIPCRTFQGWLERSGWMLTFTRATRPGACLRVVEEGHLCAGDGVEVVSRPDHGVTVALALRALTREPDLLPYLLPVEALPEEEREAIRRRLAKG
ncbi:MAG TPA: MOSC domain-containing protein [Spirillospora sp.]